MSGSTIGGIVGAAIGYYVNGAQGAQMGWMIGSAVGGYVDPDVIKGPKLTDAQTQTTMEGAPRPIVYGTAVVAGNIIQCGPLEEHEHRERSGKGGPVQETYRYTRTYAIRVCEGPVAGIRRIWRDEKLVYDVRNPDVPDDGITDPVAWSESIRAMIGDTGKFASMINIHLGDEDQLPDPALEALPPENGGGVGNVPAYRGSCYVTLIDDDLTDRQGSVPQYRFEIAAGGTVSLVTSDYGFYAAKDNTPTLLAGHDNTDLPYTLDTGVTLSTADVLVASAAGRVFMFGSGVGSVSVDRGFSWNEITGVPAAQPVALFYARNLKKYFLVVDADLCLYSSHDGRHFSNEYCPTPPGAAVECGICVTILGNDLLFIGGSGFILCSRNGWEIDVFGGEISAIAKADGGYLVAVGTAGIRRSEDFGETWSGAISHPLLSTPTVAYGNTIFVIVASNGATAYSGNNGVTWTLGDPIPESLGGLGPQSELIFNPATNEFVVASHGIYSSAAATGWVTRVAAGATEIRSLATLDFTGAETIPDIVGYYVLDGTVVSSEVGTAINPTATYLDEIVTDLAGRVGVAASQLDVTQLETTRVRGFVVNGRGGTSASDNIRSLQQAFFFDLPEWGDWPETGTKLRGIMRGGATLFDITDADLVASDEDEDTRAQTVEFPRKINLISSDPNADYNPTKQTFERRTDNVKAVGETSLELPLVLIRDEAAQKVDIMGMIAWEEAQGRWERELPEEYTALVPSDCFTQNNKRWRAEHCESGDGTVKVRAVRDRIRAYTSSATSGDALNPAGPVSNTRGPTRFAAMNLPQLRTQDNTPGMYVAACGLLPGWIGCDLQLSVDGGATFQSVLTMRNPAVIGWLTADAAAADTTLSVAVEGTLETVTLVQIAARANAFAVLTADVAEVGQFQFATGTDDGYDITGLTRGELGTVAADHGQGDPFVLLDANVYFLPIDSSHAGETLIFRPVSIGTVAANNATYSVVYEPPTYILDGGGA